MLLSKLITDAQQLLAEHGDLEVLQDYEYFPAKKVRLLEVADNHQFPPDYNMPKGTKVVLIDFDC